MEGLLNKMRVTCIYQHANIGITPDIYSHVLPGLQEAAADKFDRTFEPENSENSEGNASKWWRG